MNRLLAYLGRFAAITAGFVCAAFAASLFANVLLLGLSGWRETAPAILDGPIYFTVPFLAAFFGYHAFGPAFVAILIAEYLALRDWLYHALAGAAATIAALVLAWQRDLPGAGNALPILSMVACGMVGGLAYWLVAGRSAGEWLHGRDDDPIAPTR